MCTKVGAALVAAKWAQTWCSLVQILALSLAAMQPWASYLIFLIPGVFVFNMGMNNAQGCYEALNRVRI